MESESVRILHDKNVVSLTNEMVVNSQPEVNASHEDTTKVNIIDSRGGGNVVSGASPADMNVSGENMEASITSDDMIRAGGFGTRDDIGCFLPVASDFTDFEASLRDAQDYEDTREETGRPGLGWTEAKNQK